MTTPAPITPTRARQQPARAKAVKVPAATLGFWILTILTTGMGETASDWLARNSDPVLAVAVSGLMLTALLSAQLLARHYHSWLYWAAVAMVSVFGTVAADVVRVVLGVPYSASTYVSAVIVAALLIIWYRVEGWPATQSITTTRRELFYWATVAATFALGTAGGDLTATALGLGYLASGVLFAVAFAAPALGRRFAGRNAALAFWIAYVLTRPLGASVADWIAVPPGRGGLDLGTGPITLILIVALIAGFTGLSLRDRHAAR